MTFYEYMQSFLEDYDFVTNSEKTIVRYCFEIKRLIEEYPIYFRNELDRDIDLLVNDNEYRLELELKLYCEFNQIYKNGYSRILKLLSRYSGNEIKRASSLTIAENEFRLIDLYLLNKSLTLKLRNLLTEFLPSLSPLSQKNIFKDFRKLIIDSNQFSKSTSLGNLADNIENNVEIGVKKKYLIKKLRGKKVTILIGNTVHDITRYYKLNPIVLSQYEKIKENLTNETEIKRFFEFKKILNNHLKKYPNDESKIKEHGLLAISKNKYEMLIKLRSYISTKCFNYVVFIVEILTNEKFDYEKYDHKHLYINHRHHNVSVIRLENLYKKSEKFASEFYQFFHKYLSKIKYNELNEVSIKYNISTLRQIFINYTDSNDLEKYGLKILSADNYSYFRDIKSKINEKVIFEKLKPSTKNHYFIILKWLCDLTKQKYIRDYDDKNYNQELVKNDVLTNSYSQKELMSILYKLIEVIKINEKDCSKSLVAYFALIQITTGMNVSTLCSLKLTEEQYKQDKNIFYLNFLKARAKNNTESHVYFKNAKDKTIYLFLYIRDILRKQILEKATNPEFKTDYFFVFLSRLGELQVAHHENIVKKVNELLKDVGCDVSYDTVRMRKTVSNKVYKIVLNQFSIYRSLINHSFDVYVRHYEEISTAECNQNLSKGTKSLEIHLKREINLDIPEIKDISPESSAIINDNIIQFTPIGNCSEVPLDNIQNCSDYLACIFCKNFSVVNSEAQIHKLLDFKNICISQMMAISSSYNPESVIPLAINEFNSRIEYILNLLKQNDPKIYNLAIINYKPNQFFSL